MHNKLVVNKRRLSPRLIRIYLHLGLWVSCVSYSSSGKWCLWDLQGIFPTMCSRKVYICIRRLGNIFTICIALMFVLFAYAELYYLPNDWRLNFVVVVFFFVDRAFFELAFGFGIGFDFKQCFSLFGLIWMGFGLFQCPFSLFWRSCQTDDFDWLFKTYCIEVRAFLYRLVAH